MKIYTNILNGKNNPIDRRKYKKLHKSYKHFDILVGYIRHIPVNELKRHSIKVASIIIMKHHTR